MSVRTRRHLWLLAVSAALGATGLDAGPGESGVLDASWTAPTTNTDGTPLTDLRSYRVYYGISPSPCPGGTFVQVASATSSPGPGQTVSVRLTNLMTGVAYTVSVAAVDSSGNQSACSSSTSAAAQLDFSVTPTGTVNFGSVGLGSSATQTLTVQNTRGGTVTGTASVAAPFGVVSGSPFTLVGSGATQSVTVRFAPTSGVTASTNISFTADGDSISRLVTGVGTVPDATAPTVTITSPTPNATLTTGTASLMLGGTASDNVGVTQVTWVNTRGGSGTATGTRSWATGAIALLSGQNVLQVTARDPANNASTTTLTVTVNPASLTFTDDPLSAYSTAVKAVHIRELRTNIDSARIARGLPAFAWTDPNITPGSTPVKAVHLEELRTALAQAYQAVGRTVPTYTDPAVTPWALTISARHVSEVRAALQVL
jgi:Abnormal spindle-like microcephaly-assoc'd, ASPM-SPD-2-Hydin